LFERIDAGKGSEEEVVGRLREALRKRGEWLCGGAMFNRERVAKARHQLCLGEYVACSMALYSAHAPLAMSPHSATPL
jgi:hypothetical protein